MEDLRTELTRMAKLAPQKGYIMSGNWDMIQLKNKYNKSDYYIVEVLEDLLLQDEIRELHVNYDRNDKHILSYKFK